MDQAGEVYDFDERVRHKIDFLPTYPTHYHPSSFVATEFIFKENNNIINLV
jgi:hypothetical protein